MSNRWSRGQKLGDCKTCLCRISPQINRPDSTTESDEETSIANGELCDSQMSSQLLKTLKSMRDDESLCDVTIKVGDGSEKYAAHKIVLAAASPYFRKMFSCGLREARKGEVEFHDMQGQVLSSVLNFIYTGRIQIDESIVDALLDAADLLQLPSLRNLSLWWLNNNLNSPNCLGIYVLGQLRCHLDLAETARNYAICHFQEVMQGDEFLELSVEFLIGFLEAPYLACDNEAVLLKGLLEWVNHEVDTRKPFMRRLVEKLNLEDVSPQMLIEIIQNPAIAGEPEVEKEIRDSLTNILSKKFDGVAESERNRSTTSCSRVSRSYTQQDVIFAIGGESQGQSLSNVECFMMGVDGWKCSIPFENGTGKDLCDVAVIPTMRQCRFYAAVASVPYKLYIIGGQDCGFPLNIVERYDILQNSWETLSPLPVPVHGCGAAFVNSNLYVVGGRSSKNEKLVWMYDEKEDAWQETTPMRQHRSHLAVVGYNGGLYVLGGLGGKSENDDVFLNSVEKLDILTNAWTTLAPMHQERAFHSAAVIDCFVYSIGGCDGKLWLRTAERYDTMCGQWSKISNMSIPRSSFGISRSGDGRLYCVGGYDGVHFLRTVEKYNPRTDRWHVSCSMQIERYGVAVAQLSLPIKSNAVPCGEYS